MKKILIDGRFIGVGDSMSRYVLGFLSHLPVDSDLEFTLLVRPQGKKIAEQFLGSPSSVNRNPENGRRITDNLSIDVLDIPHYSLKEQTTLLRYLNREKFDLVHFIQFNHPILYRGKFVVTVHDLTLFGHLYRKNKVKGAAFQQVMKSAVNNSAKVIAISNATKQAIVDNYGIDSKKIAVTYLAVDEKYNTGIRNKVEGIRLAKSKYKITGDYILYTGMWKRHKNIIRMLKAFEQYSLTVNRSPFSNSKSDNGQRNTGNGLQLVLAGKIDQNEPEVIDEIKRINTVLSDNGQRKTENAAILAVGFVDEADLPYLYSGALAYCIPSLSEGFGLPPLEAMACGTPVISSNVSAMPEILGDAPLYFDPYGIQEIEKTIKRIVIDEKLRVELSKKGIEQAAKYSWSKTAKETLKVYIEALESSR